MLTRDEHDGLVQRIYSSAMGDAPWSVTLEAIAGSFGTSKALIQLADAKRNIVSYRVHGYSDDFSSNFYRSEIYGKDPRLSYFHGVRPGQLYFDHALFDVEEMNRDPHVRACVDALGVQYQLGAIMSLPDGAKAWLTLLSTAKEGHATDAAIEAYRRLAPHIAQALTFGQVMERHVATQAALLEALSTRADGVVLVGRSGAATFVNDAARTILAAADGLTYSKGQFAALRGPETRRLRKLIADAIAPMPASESRRGGEMLVTRAGGARPYVVRVMAAPRSEQFLTSFGIAAMIHLHDLAAVHLPPHGLLMSAFGLSEREADLAIELARCANLAGAAANAGMAFNTARNHLQGIFRKSGTASQAEAVQLFSRLA